MRYRDRKNRIRSEIASLKEQKQYYIDRIVQLKQQRSEARSIEDKLVIQVQLEPHYWELNRIQRELSDKYQELSAIATT